MHWCVVQLEIKHGSPVVLDSIFYACDQKNGDKGNASQSRVRGAKYWENLEQIKTTNQTLSSDEDKMVSEDKPAR